MRKVLILLVVFAVIGTAAFADGKFTAWNYGLAFLYAQVGSNAAQAGWGPNFDKAVGAGPDNEWAFSYDGKGYGFTAAFEFALLTNANGQPGLALGTPSWQWWGTYFKPFGDVLKVTLGAPRIDYVQWSYLEGFGAYSRYIGSDLSVTAEIKPVTGLTVGLTEFIPWGGAAGLNMGNFGTGTNMDFGNNFGLLASYTMDNLGTFTAQYKRQDSNGGGALTSTELGVGVAISAIKNLSINAGFGMAASTTNGIDNYLMTVDASAKVTMSPMWLAVDAAFKQVSTSLSSFAVEAGGEYDMGMLGVGAQVGYDDGNGVNLIGELASGAWAGFEVQPYVAANFDNGSYIRVGLVYASGAGTGVEKDAVIAIPITYLWAF
jgi:hypothetical protein